LSFVITITGVAEAIASITKLRAKIPDACEEGLTQIANVIIKEAQRIVPVDTGRLRDSIKVFSTSATEVKGGTEVFYAGFVEFGTARQRSQPYMRPAIDKGKKEGPKLLLASLRKLM
jgi:HK97 gp10 family phage protein